MHTWHLAAFTSPQGWGIIVAVIEGKEYAMAIRFNINRRKTAEAIVWIVRRGESNLYNAMKILFAADKYHLNRYGRPVTGDRYVAMQYGTVPSAAYAMAKAPEPGIGFAKSGNRLILDKGRVFDMSLFSESDEEALEHGFKEYAGMSFGDVVDKNHAEVAWAKAVKRTPKADVSEILFEDMIEEKWLVDDLKEMSHCLVI